jgi:N-sulfoglucosamine sulfohydrolase
MWNTDERSGRQLFRARGGRLSEWSKNLLAHGSSWDISLRLGCRPLPRLVGLALFFLVCTATRETLAKDAEGGGRPNFLIIMADDCTFNDLPMYGGLNAKTPNLDMLARESLVFERAFLCSAMCQPCRAELFTGQYPMRNGCAWNHSASRPGVRSLPQILGGVGYRVGIAGKIHVKPDSVFPFEKVDGYDRNCVRNPTNVHNLDAVRKFVSRDPTEPFCLVVALVEPHVPWVMGNPREYPPEEIKLPPNIADTQRTREDFGRYLAEISYMDGQVGELLEILETTNAAEDTVVLFTSEQGSQFPGCKWTNFNTGVHTAMMVRWPGITEGGERTSALVQYADVAPTLLEISGSSGDKETFDGSSFAGVLRGEASKHRDYVFGMHNNMPEGPAYPIRSVTDGRFHLIRNLTPDEIYIEKHLMGIKGEGALNNPYWGTWIWDASTDPKTYGLVKRYMTRPAVQLFDLAADPYEMKNLAEDPDFRSVREDLSAALEQWMKVQGDPGIEQDTDESLNAARRGKHRYYPGLSELK